MNPKFVYLFNVVAVAVIAVLWLTDVIGLTMFFGLLLIEASVSIWLAVLYMRREKEQVTAFHDLFETMVDQRKDEKRDVSSRENVT